MPNFYDIGDLVPLTSSFGSGGVPADPATVILYIRQPDNTLMTLTYSGGDLTKVSTGVYSYDLSLTQVGEYWYNWIGAGGVQASEENNFFVRPNRTLQEVTTPYTPPAYVDVLQGMLDTQLQTMLDAHVSISVKSYGAQGDGATDDTLSIQNAINACPDGSEVYFPKGLYKIAAPISITGNISLRGEWVSEIYGTHAATSDGLPGSAPWLTGSVLLQSAAATNGINVTGSGTNVSIENIGIRFADAIAFNNTGHGVYAVASALTGGFHENGVCNCRWDNVVVFGHDGNHYAFYSLNMILAKISHLRGYGGGGWYMECDSAGGNFGNTICEDLYFALISGGTSHGFSLKSRTTSFPGVLNMVVFIRPHCGISASPAGNLSSNFTMPAPTNAQYLWKDVGNPSTISLIAPDFECGNAIGSSVSFGYWTYCQLEGGYFSKPNGVFFKYRRKLICDAKPTLQLWGGAGLTGTPTGSVKALYATDSNDDRGVIEFTTSQTLPAGDTYAIMTVTMPSILMVGMVFLQPVVTSGNSRVALDAGLYTHNLAANSFEVWAHTTLTQNTTYAFKYFVVE